MEAINLFVPNADGTSPLVTATAPLPTSMPLVTATAPLSVNLPLVTATAPLSVALPLVTAAVPLSVNLPLVTAAAPLSVALTVGASVVATIVSAANTASGSTADLAVGRLAALGVDVNVTAVSGSSPSISFVLERKGSDGIYYPLASPAALTAAGQISLSVGRGLTTAAALGTAVRLRWVITGTTPSFTFSASIVGK